ncbi:MAG: TdeIII family type II restriction endonuclease [Fimbriimonadales bacterium]|jgi:hypothetical protein|nr:TdeIII family type II restriction endonuclease [Armatimonadota bacterium]MCX7686436.1 TdeIII family type II restriction endonuclease [Fimbriimonadales bacterium]CUU11363.1 Type II restriction endonuclease, TdeIII [Armatimonadetes bacterium GBS]CUU33864.1 Type II restriction endonuclease, TdeIII [Armatimonadetes bacterium GXS]CUU35403.1 Type II restriction endonuclease, TdeIII [Armatimonadetes bacterium DC]
MAGGDPINYKTQEQIKSYLRKFIEKLLSETKGDDKKVSHDSTANKATLKPFHAAVLPAPLRGISELERKFSTRLGSTFEQCALFIARQYHRDARRNHKISAQVSKEAIDAIDAQVRNFERMATKGQRLAFADMVNSVLAAGASSATQFLEATADIYILTHNGNELFFEIKSPQPNKGQCLEVTQRLLRIHLIKGKPRPEVQAYFALPYNPYGHSREDYQWNYAKNYAPFEDAVLIGAEFWNLIGGEGTYEALLAIYEEVGREFEQKILQTFGIRSSS